MSCVGLSSISSKNVSSGASPTSLKKNKCSTAFRPATNGRSMSVHQGNLGVREVVVALNMYVYTEFNKSLVDLYTVGV